MNALYQEAATQHLLRDFQTLSLTGRTRAWAPGRHWQPVNPADLDRVQAALSAHFTVRGSMQNLRWSALPFFGAAHLVTSQEGLDQWEPGDAPPGIALWHPDHAAALVLNRTNTPVYDAVERFGLHGELPLLMDYVKFFFDSVIGSLGAFTIVEALADFPWSEDITHDEKARVFEQLQPLRVVEASSSKFIDLSATILFKNALFSSKIRLALDTVADDGEHGELCRGQMYLFDEQALLENLNVLQIGSPD